MSDAERITDLELELMVQRDLLEELNRQLTAANRTVERLEERVRLLEGQTEQLVREVFPNPNDEPPHY
jgi:uncharacterized coiled-coil protein SlyX